ncbi:hypothetical protein BDA99DRAFT_260502 [Phascolomyces articulosus]|uniref:CNNM transmembrane domain-containing protein n=1 Tax=Phascolomyces articulosus TaxID=60185 RepID=A0AAD5JNB5_9FUNG|nr:hypothetical protein BDA99DRAFT_260502 [Phascolomyces articulosus]
MSIPLIRSSCYSGWKIPSMRIINIFLLIFILDHSHPNVIFVHAAGDHDPIPASSPEFWGQIVAIFALVICSGIVAGLTLGLMSQDATNLAILSAAGTAKQQKHAARIMPIRKNGHLLLTALLLTNTVLNETLPILCDGLFGKGYVAVIISTALIVLFSEIIPQAICSRHGLAIGAFFAIPVRVLIGFWYILAWPMAKLLDTILGKHSGILYGIAELRELINLHSEEPLSSNTLGGDSDDHHHSGPLKKSTVEILRNTLDLSLYSAGDLVNQTRQPFMLHIDTQLDKEMMNTILKSECTTIPVYKYRNLNDTDHDAIHGESHRIILGVLKIKSLSRLDPADRTPLSKIALEPVLQLPATTPATMLLQMLENDNNRMAEVYMSRGPPTVSSTITGVEEAAIVPKSFNYSIHKEEQESERNNNINMDDQVSPHQQIHRNEDDTRSKRSPMSGCITRIFRHHKRPDDDPSYNNSNVRGTKDVQHRTIDEKQQVSALSDTSSTQSSSSSSYSESHSPYVQDTFVLGMITFEEVLVRLIRAEVINIQPHHHKQEDPTQLTNVLIHTKENNYDDDRGNKHYVINGEDARMIQQHQFNHCRHETTHTFDHSITSIKEPQQQSWINQRPCQSTTDIHKKVKKVKEDRTENCSNSSSSSTTESTVISKPNSISEL